MHWKNVAIALMAVALVWLCLRLEDVERQRYALLTGLCKFNPANVKSLDCLETAKPRSSWAWNLFYGIMK